MTVEKLVTVVAVEAEGREGRQIAARANADFEAAATQQVGDDGILGDADRQLQRQGDDAGAQANARGVGRDMRQEDEGRGQAAFSFVEMMLGDPGRIEAVLLGVDDLFGGESIALGGCRLVEQAGEEAEALDRERRHGVNLA